MLSRFPVEARASADIAISSVAKTIPVRAPGLIIASLIRPLACAASTAF